MKKEEIIAISQQNHTINYNYSLVTDTKMSDNVDIICPLHGIFHPRLSRFLKGSNCPICSGKTRKTKEDFVSSSNIVHNNFYSYDKFIYINAHTKGVITCPIHGDFEQTPTNHLNGNGCRKCLSDKMKQTFSSNTEEFIKKSLKIHNGYYSYDKTNYINNTTKVTITCPIHGDFEQAPHNHLQGKGCPLCKISHLEREINDFLEQHTIKFEREKHFDWLGRLSLDFYLPQYNIAIECQGKQHFGLGYALDEMLSHEILERDSRKHALCAENNIDLIYFLDTKQEISEEHQHIYTPTNTFSSTEDILTYIKQKES